MDDESPGARLQASLRDPPCAVGVADRLSTVFDWRSRVRIGANEPAAGPVGCGGRQPVPEVDSGRVRQIEFGCATVGRRRSSRPEGVDPGEKQG